MTVDPTVIPGLLLLAAELVVLAAVGYVVVRVALRQDDERMALAQGLVVGPALWGLITNFVLYAVPGLAGAAVGWGLMLAIGAGLAWRAPDRICPRPHVAAGFAVAVLALFWAALASRQLLGIPDLPIHLGLAATIRAGGFPPELPWNPGMPLHYHHGPPLMVGLLAPPFGPDLAFVSELLGRLCLDELCACGCDRAIAARVVDDRTDPCATPGHYRCLDNRRVDLEERGRGASADPSRGGGTVRRLGRVTG